MIGFIGGLALGLGLAVLAFAFFRRAMEGSE